MLLPPPSTASRAEYHTISSGSAYSSTIATMDNEAAESGKLIAPFEPIVCEVLTDEIRAFNSNAGTSSVAQYSLPAFEADSLEAAMNQATVAIKYHAKWFATDPLAGLLNAVFEAASTSSSSAVLHSALRLIDTVHTYSALPPGICLSQTARFIAQTYYSASRAHKTKKLAKSAWGVAMHVLHSHLGPQVLDALYHILGSGDLFSKRGLAEKTGALMLIKKCARSQAAGLPEISVTMLLVELKLAALTGGDIIQEHVVNLLTELLSSDKYVQHLHQDAQWPNLLDIVDHCVLHFSDRAGLQALVHTLPPKVPDVDRENLARVSQLFIRLSLPLTVLLSNAITAPWSTILPHDQRNTELDSILQLLSSNTLYKKELDTLMDKRVFAYLSCTSLLDRAHFLVDLQDRILALTTPQAMADIMSINLLTMFKVALETDHEGQEIANLFVVLCNVARRSLACTKMLFRIRKDVKGALYLNPAPQYGDLVFTELPIFLPVQHGFYVLCDIFDHGAQSWEVYEYVLKATKGLLGNHTLFARNLQPVRDLLHIVSQTLEAGTYPEPPAYTGLSKSHVAAHLVQTLTAIMSYHRRLTKQEVLNLVSIFDRTAGSRDYIVSIQCIHALTICCYEVPDIMSSHMDGVINKMSRMATQRYLAIHVLQFLAGLSRLPDLYRNFQEADYMRVFGVCYSYLQSTRDVQSTTERRGTPTSERSSLARDEEALSEYVYSLAHHVITFWYMSLRSQDRATCKQYITRCLTVEVNGKPIFEDQGLVTIDMMDRIDSEIASGNTDSGSTEDTIASGAAAVPRPFITADGRLIELHRLVGLLLVTTLTSLRTGKTLLTVRRPSGTAWRIIEKERAHITVDGDENDFLKVMPQDIDDHKGRIYGKTYGTISIPSPSSALETSTVITFPEEEGVKRAIEAFDRTSALDSHKAGVVYIGERQNTEERVLQNIAGSPDYREFLHGLGDWHLLKGATFNTQGLDRADDTDGEVALVWHNQVTEVVFHVTTVMPNSEDARENTAKKKRHIGNNHVNIVFNNSGGKLDFTTLYNMFPGQLTYVYIVITPSARTSFLEARILNISTDKRDRFYGVEVVTRPDYPNISPAAEMKVVSGASLPGFVRNLVLNECIISLMWTLRDDPESDYPSSWRSRLHQLRRIRERYGSISRQVATNARRST